MTYRNTTVDVFFLKRKSATERDFAEKEERVYSVFQRKNEMCLKEWVRKIQLKYFASTVNVGEHTNGCL